MNDAVLRADRLRKNFGDKEVLRGVDLAIEPGTVLGLLSANGLWAIRSAGQTWLNLEFV